MSAAAMTTSPSTGTTMTPTPRSALRWALADGWVLTLRTLHHWQRQPGEVAVNLLFPVLMVLIFGYLLGGGIAVPGGGSYMEFLLPGMFALAMLFGLEGTMTAVSTDTAKGVTDRFRSMPMSSAGVVVGRCIADMLSSTVSLAVMLVAGVLVGWRWHGSLAEALAAVGLLLALRFALLWAGIYLGLLVSSPAMVTAVQILVWPFAFLSNAFVPTETMPAWLGTLADWNPMAATVAATRDLFGNPGVPAEGFFAEHALTMAVVWPTVISLVFFVLAVRRWRSLGR